MHRCSGSRATARGPGDDPSEQRLDVAVLALRARADDEFRLKSAQDIEDGPQLRAGFTGLCGRNRGLPQAGFAANAILAVAARTPITTQRVAELLRGADDLLYAALPSA